MVDSDDDIRIGINGMSPKSTQWLIEQIQYLHNICEWVTMNGFQTKWSNVWLSNLDLLSTEDSTVRQISIFSDIIAKLIKIVNQIQYLVICKKHY